MKTKLKDFILKILFPIAILFLFQYIGNLLNRYVIGIIPGPIIGMLLLLLALKIKLVSYHLMKDFSNFFVKHISFFLIPTTVSIMAIFSIHKTSLPYLLIALLLSLVIVLTLVSYFVIFLTKSNSTIEDKEN